MASSGGGDRDLYDEINITPMLDLAYVLLVIFIIIMTTATVEGIKVHPQGQRPAEPGAEQDQGDHGQRRWHDLPGHLPGHDEPA